MYKKCSTVGLFIIFIHRFHVHGTNLGFCYSQNMWAPQSWSIPFKHFKMIKMAMGLSFVSKFHRFYIFIKSPKSKIYDSKFCGPHLYDPNHSNSLECHFFPMLSALMFLFIIYFKIFMKNVEMVKVLWKNVEPLDPLIFIYEDVWKRETIESVSHIPQLHMKTFHISKAKLTNHP